MAARPCDLCRATPALLFCHGHSAFLCSPCDSSLHAHHHHNPQQQQQQRHERVWLCDACEQAPAAFNCKADSASLCLTCDADIHSANPLSRRHDRSPVVPFLHSPLAKPPPFTNFLDHEDIDQVEEAAGSGRATSYWLFPKGEAVGAPESRSGRGTALDLPSFFTASEEVDPYLDLDYASSIDLNNSSTPMFHHQRKHNESVVPVQSQHHQHHPPQAAAAPFFPAPAAGSYSICSHSVRPLAPQSQPKCLSFSSVATGGRTCSNEFDRLLASVQVSSSEVGVVPDGSVVADVTNPCGSGGQVGPVVAVGMDREARVMRYREKRKTRRFGKTVRYASRKAYAEMRPRIKGRFAKRTETEADAEVAASFFYHGGSAGGIMVDSGYGVVPSF